MLIGVTEIFTEIHQGTYDIYVQVRSSTHKHKPLICQESTDQGCSKKSIKRRRAAIGTVHYPASEAALSIAEEPRELTLMFFFNQDRPLDWHRERYSHVWSDRTNI